MKLAALLAHAWHRHRVALFFLAAGLFTFEWLITRLAPVSSQSGALQQLLQFLPPAVMELFGDDIAANLNPAGALSFGYIHPFAIMLLAAWAVRVPAAGLAGEVGDGTMDLIASRGVRRGTIVGASLLALGLGLIVIAGAGWAGTAAGIASRAELGLGARAFLPIALVCTLLFFAFGCVTLAVSAARRAGGPTLGTGAAIIAVSYALDFVARAWPPIRWLRPVSLFAWYHPRDILLAGLSPAEWVPMAATAVVASLAAALLFARRDV